MKRILVFFFVFFILLGCSSTKSKVNPLIEDFLKEHIANPDTYKPGLSEVIQEGTIDVKATRYWRDIPQEGIIDVVVLRHEFKTVDDTNTPVDNTFIFYMNPAQDVLYYAHKDKGFLLFPVE